MRLRPVLLGCTAAAVAMASVHGPLAETGHLALALFLALTACTYPGALLAQNSSTMTVASELAVAATVLVLAYAGATGSVVWLGAGYALHGLWDWLHDLQLVSTRVATWFPPLCAAFDLVVAGWILVVLA
ncbi:MAG: DUF6010 family protein [Gemmatimonadota bacterium]